MNDQDREYVQIPSSHHFGLIFVGMPFVIHGGLWAGSFEDYTHAVEEMEKREKAGDIGYHVFPLDAEHPRWGKIARTCRRYFGGPEE